jgi:hypothetical protein
MGASRLSWRGGCHGPCRGGWPCRLSWSQPGPGACVLMVCGQAGAGCESVCVCETSASSDHQPPPRRWLNLDRSVRRPPRPTKQKPHPQTVDEPQLLRRAYTEARLAIRSTQAASRHSSRPGGAAAHIRKGKLDQKIRISSASRHVSSAFVGLLGQQQSPAFFV